MSALNKLQRTMLRGWAINMALAPCYSRTRWFGFDYTTAEEARLRAIARKCVARDIGSQFIFMAVTAIVAAIIIHYIQAAAFCSAAK